MKPTPNRLEREEFIAGYLLEADEHIRSAITNLLAAETALRTDAPQHRLVRELFRSLHTLKGLSAMVGIDPVVDLAHEMETILRDADRSTGKLSHAAVELLLKGVRAIEHRVGAFAKNDAVAAAPRELLEALGHLQGMSAPTPIPAGELLSLDAAIVDKLAPMEREQLVGSIAKGGRALRIDFSPSPERSAQGFSITSVRESIGALGEIVKVIPRSVPKTDDAPGGLAFTLIVLSDATIEALAGAAATDPTTIATITLAQQPTTPADFELHDDDAIEATLSKGSIRVDVTRLDDALEKLSALVVTRFKLTNAVASLRERGVDVREVSAILAENHRQLRDLRGAIARARMVSVAELLERVPLIVRGMSRSTGKQVHLVIDAGRAELDKAVAERAFPAIVHLVRNAVDHAIESPEQRAQLGKPEEGVVTVKCFEHSDTQLEICISDDGRGIDAVAVARRAGRPVPTDERGLLELITMPGLSTMQTATNTSGRGMGMDIVRRIAVDVLGGDLSLRTTPGVGTEITLRLPMSIAILDSFSFMCGQQTFAVPVAMIDEIIDLHGANVVRTPRVGNTRQSETRLLERRGEAIPLYVLGSLLRLFEAPDTKGKAFIIRSHGQPFALAIDRVLGQQEIVVRPVEDPLVKMPGIAGTTDLGDGQPTLVLDLIGLSARAADLSAATAAAPAGASA